MTTIGSPVRARTLARWPSDASNSATWSRTHFRCAGLVLSDECHVSQNTTRDRQVFRRAIASRRMSAIDGVSETFDPDAWDVVPGFDDLTDLTYHRARAHGTVRIAFDRPDVLNAFRPHTVDELLRVLEHARISSDVGCVLLTGNGPSAKNGKRAFCTGGDQRIRGRAGYQYAEGETGRDRRQGEARAAAHPGVPAADPVHAEGRHRAWCPAGRPAAATACTWSAT